jgi:hypothetical protein
MGPPSLALARDGRSALIVWAEGNDHRNRAKVLARRIDTTGRPEGPPARVSPELDTRFSSASSIQVSLIPSVRGYDTSWSFVPRHQRPARLAYRALDVRGRPSGPLHTLPLHFGLPGDPVDQGPKYSITDGPSGGVLMTLRPDRPGQTYASPLAR